jgi:hypothetical protein
MQMQTQSPRAPPPAPGGGGGDGGDAGVELFPTDDALNEELLRFGARVASAAVTSLHALSGLKKWVDDNGGDYKREKSEEQAWVKHAEDSCVDLRCLLPSWRPAACDDLPAWAKRAPAATYMAMEPLLKRLQLSDEAFAQAPQSFFIEAPDEPVTPERPFFRPLFSAASCADDSNFRPPDFPFFSKDIASPEEGFLLHFARAMMPPDLVALFGNAANWTKLLSDSAEGLLNRLKMTAAGKNSPPRDTSPRLKAFTFVLTKLVPSFLVGATGGASPLKVAAACFLEALELGPSLVNRGVVVNVEDIDTQKQRFCADIQVSSMSLLHKKSAWQWRYMLREGDGKKEFERLMPEAWARKGVDLTTRDPILHALRLRYNRMQIGETREPEERWSNVVKASSSELDAAGVVPELLLARMVPEEAGDPFTRDGKTSIEENYYLAILNGRLERTFDCVMTLSDFPGDYQTLAVDFSSVWDARYATFLHHQATNFDKLGVSLFAGGFHALGPDNPDTTIMPGVELALQRDAQWEKGTDNSPCLRLGRGGAISVSKGMTVSVSDTEYRVKKVDAANDKVVLEPLPASQNASAPGSGANEDLTQRVVTFFPAAGDAQRQAWKFVKRADVNSIWKIDKESGFRMGDTLGVSCKLSAAPHLAPKPCLHPTQTPPKSNPKRARGERQSRVEVSLSPAPQNENACAITSPPYQ